MNKLHVHYQAWGEHWHWGTLADDGRELLFEYSPEALRQGLELSPHRLPLRAQAFGGFPAHQMRLPGIVADALPDGWGLLLMDRLLRHQGLDTARLSPLDRLAFLGDRAMGAFGFEPAQAMALTDTDTSLLQLARQAQAVDSGRDIEVLRRMVMVGGSPHGARPKVLVHYHAKSGAISTQPTPGFEPWLIKFPARGEHREVCGIETLYADLARRCGLDMPSTRHFDLGQSLAAFGVARFDREAGQRVPLHTLAGLLHADFRIPGAVGYTQLLRATRLITRDEREVKKAFERAVFNVLFHNRDDHPKNLSFRLGRDRHWRLAPCYDLTFSQGAGGEHQMDVCGAGRDISRAPMLQLATQGGLDTRWAAAVIDRLAQVAAELPHTLPDWPIRRATLRALVATVRVNQALLRGPTFPTT